MDLHLRGRTALVTGAGQGIGREIGAALAREGANVAFHYLSSGAGATEAADQATELGVRACAVAGDLADPDSVTALVDEVHQRLGSVDVLVNNAAYTNMGPFLTDDPADWRRQVDVTVLGMLHVTRAVLPDMVEAGGGAIVTMAGDSGRVGESRAVVTSTCRASAYGFTKAMAKEFARNGIRANCVSLGLVRSPSVDRHMIAGASDEFMNRLIRAYPLRRLGEMDDVVPAVLLLASPVSGWITGQVLSVNGGFATG
ncbi:MAG TPA: SDR family oxidoreductase [Mycobacteriales bacterium]|jgi:Dehydrogenases with different specificities (related to short-chain alcohol dehydrogenases)